ncbi:tRNA pseudouridine(55) synthase TruB [Bacillus sp. HMF5848]|uniref:tRNA pseudouridine(55) synthase TruB n=1 Tax=Bacillus sp. HMF5848 TaxID=2495421 RepID=UPI000F799058|nr:tRNA pseudouridine(55) synthase TruB [Bacillus sp. HMF5848]RSK27074.1 tRNA pseudouridine(55) synthase TruB [Bacillus sp. HMF5848]
MEGVLILNKPAGMTSHDCVYRMRKYARTKKVGHTGTLDPEVTGVLPICIGRATKIVDLLTADNKVYEGKVTLGISTTTEDQTGEIVDKKAIDKSISYDDIAQVFNELTGTIEQIPPMYSAVKVNGKKLYEYARKGIEVERPSRQVTIHSFEILDNFDELPLGETVTFSFRVHASKGTYVRTLAVMVGEKLGYPAHMSQLTRIKSGEFSIEQSITLQEAEQLSENGMLQEKLISIEDALFYLPKWHLHGTLQSKVKNGAVLSVPAQFEHIEEDQPLQMLDEAGNLLALYIKHPTKPGLLKPLKVLRNN